MGVVGWVYAITLGTHAPALYWLFRLPSGWCRFLYGATMTASLLMHISERKHKLPGLLLAKHAGLFLNLDRTMSLVSLIVTIWTVYHGKMWSSIMYGALSLIFNGLSEADAWVVRVNTLVEEGRLSHAFRLPFFASPTHQWVWYSLWHGAWHLACFDLLGYVLYHGYEHIAPHQ